MKDFSKKKIQKYSEPYIQEQFNVCLQHMKINRQLFSHYIPIDRFISKKTPTSEETKKT